MKLDGLRSGTLYHYRLVGTNSVGVGLPDADRTFRTYPVGFDDQCPNAHVRQQTGAAFLLDCRAYELASAYDAGGYDVESDLVAGQSPSGDIRWRSTRRGSSTRPTRAASRERAAPPTTVSTPTSPPASESGWNTTYVGVPADNPFATAPFGSPLLEAEREPRHLRLRWARQLFAVLRRRQGRSAGPPPRRASRPGDGGSLDPGPGAAPSGYIGRHLSADGTRFVFGSTAQFEPDGNSNGDVSIYVRDLAGEETHVVSKTPAGATMTGSGIGELDISSDGDRVVFGRQLATDSAGNRYWHLYLSLRGGAQSIDLMPGATAGVLYDGMTADGTWSSSRPRTSSPETTKTRASISTGPMWPAPPPP